jgi:hypothetical protein
MASLVVSITLLSLYLLQVLSGLYDETEIVSVINNVDKQRLLINKEGYLCIPAAN